MLRTARSLLLAAATLAAAGCASLPASTDVLFVVVRHAEKATDPPEDPALSAAGEARAAALAARLSAEPLAAVYATPYRRTRQTAAPSARRHGLAVGTYDAGQPVAEFVARLRRDHAQGAVLVVGHSNTVPEIVAALCACRVAPIDESAYGDRYDVRLRTYGATLRRGRY